MVLFNSAQVSVELYVPCSQSKYDGLVFPLELVDCIFWVGLGHVAMYHSASCVVCPVIEPVLLDVSLDHLNRVSYDTGTSGWGSAAPRLARASASSFPLIPLWPGIHCNTTSTG